MRSGTPRRRPGKCRFGYYSPLGVGGDGRAATATFTLTRTAPYTDALTVNVSVSQTGVVARPGANR